MDLNNSQNTKAKNSFGFKKGNIAITVISLVLAFALGISGGFISAKYLISKIPEKQSGVVVNPNPSNVTITVDESSNSNIEAVAKKVSPSVVFVRTSTAVNDFFGGQIKSQGEGNGIIYSEDGYIITNYSVIKKATEDANVNIEVFFDFNKKKPLKAEVVGYNISYDLAVLKVEAENLNPVSMADVKKLAVGQYVAAVGSPGGIDYMGTVTYGIISGLNRNIASSAKNDTSLSLVQTDAILNNDSTGTAIFNIKGELIGIHSSSIVAENFNGMGFAIPVSKIIEVCNGVIDNEATPDPYIGVTFSESWTADRLVQFEYPVGAVVNNVVDGGPASIAGIKNGDIITEFGSESIKDFEGLNNLISNCEPGQTVSVKFYRSGRYYTTAITVGSNNAQ